ncbi:hypothetical protein [Flavobacterium sp. K5-23]|uniref:hypothetical protein n=1 Tax=Flavobacterium sp. K5-23 TaxID=2746225 RepID=UPI002010C09D|nr:hypothetical protein [Flavobacterium sp. K5-23]UQD56820.1 hypothetical protein FLAK523_10625 [Flavobacterium sp. K5-23]
MNILKSENVLGKWLTTCYFVFAFVEVIAEYYFCKPILFIFKPLMFVPLVILYWKNSKERSYIFFGIIFFLLITNVFFIPNTEGMLYIGAVAYLFHRVLMILYIIRLSKLRDYFPVLIGVIPFLFFFFYLLSISGELPKDSLVVLVLQNILMSILGGMILSFYMMKGSLYNSWILIFGLLSVSVYFVVFVEKVYLNHLSLIVFRPLAMILNTMVYYTFYRFVMEFENKNAGSKELFVN